MKKNDTVKSSSNKREFLITILKSALAFVMLFNFYQIYFLDGELSSSSSPSNSHDSLMMIPSSALSWNKEKAKAKKKKKQKQKFQQEPEDDDNVYEISSGKKFILKMLRDAGIENIDKETLDKLPTKEQIDQLYFSSSSSSSSPNQNQNSRSRSRNNNKELKLNDHLKSKNDSHRKSNEPIILGLESCETYRNKVPKEKRHIGAAGTFNTGTHLVTRYLLDHCSFLSEENEAQKKRRWLKQKKEVNFRYRTSTSVIFQVPWGKHVLESLRNVQIPARFQKVDKQTGEIKSKYDKDNTLPVIMVRDIYTWMKSTCKRNYGLQFHHNTTNHCPNIIINTDDINDFPFLSGKEGSTTNVKIRKWGKYGNDTFSWNSLPEFYIDFYKQYYLQGIQDQTTTTTTGDNVYKTTPSPPYPKLFVRFEDLIFYPKETITKICSCAGGTMYFKNKTATAEAPSSSSTTTTTAVTKATMEEDNTRDDKAYTFQYSLDSAKGGIKGHRGELTGFISSIIKYGALQHNRTYRYSGYTHDDLKYVLDLFYNKKDDYNHANTGNRNFAYDFFVDKLNYKIETETS